MNEVVPKKERKKERTNDVQRLPLEKVDIHLLTNPTGPHDGAGIPTKNWLGIPIPQTDEWKRVIQQIRMMAGQEGASESHVARLYILEGYDKHFPGNPALPLDHWTTGEPFSKAAEEKLSLTANVYKPERKPPPSTPDYKSMSNEELLTLVRESKQGSFDRMAAKAFLKKRGISWEEV